MMMRIVMMARMVRLNWPLYLYWLDSRKMDDIDVIYLKLRFFLYNHVVTAQQQQHKSWRVEVEGHDDGEGYICEKRIPIVQVYHSHHHKRTLDLMGEMDLKLNHLQLLSSCSLILFHCECLLG